MIQISNQARKALEELRGELAEELKRIDRLVDQTCQRRAEVATLSRLIEREIGIASDAAPQPPSQEEAQEPAAAEAQEAAEGDAAEAPPPDPPPPATDSSEPLIERVYAALRDLTEGGAWAQPDAVAERVAISTGAAREQLERLAKQERADFAKIGPGEPKYHPRAKWKYRVASAAHPTLRKAATGNGSPAAPKTAPESDDPESRLKAAARRLNRPATVVEIHQEAGLEETYVVSRQLIQAGLKRGEWLRANGGDPDKPQALYQLNEQ